MATACASGRPNSPVETAIEPIASPSPLPVANLDWFFRQDEEGAYLAFGMAESDDVRLGMSCTPGSGALDLWRDSADGNVREIHLESGGDTERYPAKTDESLMSGGVYLTAQARTSDPVIQRFRRLGWIAVLEPDHRDTLVVHPESEAGIADFFSACD